MRVLGSAVECLLGQADEVGALAAQVEPQLRQLIVAWDR
jgi:hypothetical protein